MTNWISARRHGTLILRIGEAPDSLVLQAVGEVDHASAPALEHSLLRALESRASSIVLDLNGVSFIDAAGLRVMLWATATSRREGGRLRVDCESAAIRRLFDLPGAGAEPHS